MLLKFEIIVMIFVFSILDNARSASVDSGFRGEGFGPYALLDGQLTDQYLAVGKVIFSTGGFCTGTLISPNVVLTAAHCLTDPMTLKNPIGPCGKSGSTDFYTGNLFQTVSFEVNTSKGNYTYTGLSSKSFGSELGKDDLGLILLAQPVPTSLVRPLRLLPTKPKVEEPVATLGYGCQSRVFSNECGTFEPVKGGLRGRKQIVYSKFGDPAHNSCPGDSGGPSLTTSNLGIYGVSSSFKNRMSDEDRRRSKEPTSFSGDVNLHFQAIEQIVSDTKDRCSDLRFVHGDKVFKYGTCMEASTCQSIHGTMSSDNCPNHSRGIGCCHTDADPIFEGLPN